jgi:hypothetical protein
MNTIRIVQMLLLFDQKSSADYGLALWASLHEVEAFYNVNERKMDVQRLYISPDVFLHTLNAKFAPTQAKKALDFLRQDESGQASHQGNEFIYDQKRLVELTRESVLRQQFGPAASAIPLMIVTDRFIKPPENWTYIISDSWVEPQLSAVISAVPLDPAYWETYDSHRVATIKYRTRTAVMCLKACDNPLCFLYSPVDSVTNLDRMFILGDEHSSEIEGLSGYGFERTMNDPNVVQQVILLPSGASGRLK